ncbi:MAG: TRAP transporter large permease [Rhodospirillales bacterium]|jgi:tripartite ATP-independent transporter DctM subunit|nr:TRAP transporter large permease [Rhodospirillales bacterium]
MDMLVLFFAFLAMLALMFLSMPVAVAILAVGAAGGYLAYGMPLVATMGGVVWGSLNNSTMLAIPLFMLLGELLLRSGIADRMYDALAVWLGRMPGGLLHTNIATCTMFAATSGSSVATAATVGTIALPALAQRNYPVRMSLGSLAAGGTLGILIPPSINLLVYGSLANVSVGKLFMAGIVPGFALAVCFSLFIFIVYRRANEGGTTSTIPFRERLALLRHLIPPFIIFAIVMGSIYGGLATPTESAALGVTAALAITWWSGRLSLSLLATCSFLAARTTGMVVIVLVCALLLNVSISMLGAAQEVTRWVTDLGLDRVSLLLVLMVFYMTLGMFMDAMSMLVLTVPIAVPVVVAVGVDPIWFGIFIVLMCEVALITPPVGMNLFVVQGIRKDGGSFTDVAWGSAPFAVIMLVASVIFIFWPEPILWLPNVMSGQP